MCIKKSFVNPLILLLMLFLVSSGCATTQINKKAVTLITNDQTKLEATYYPPLATNSPSVILLPDTRSDRKYFGNLASKLNEAGFGVLAIDFRYKDLIARSGSISEQIRTIQKQDLMALVDYDMRCAIDFLTHQDSIDPERIGIVGTSLGSRVGLVSGAKYGLKALVLVSLSGPVAFPNGKPIIQLLEEYGERPILFMTSERDWGGNGTAAEDNKLFYEWAKGEKELKIWAGSGHGMEILLRKEASNLVLSWLKQYL